MAVPLVVEPGGFTPEAENFEAFLRLKEDPKLCCQYVKTV